MHIIKPQVDSKSQDMDNLSDMEAHDQSKEWTSFRRVQQHNRALQKMAKTKLFLLQTDLSSPL